MSGSQFLVESNFGKCGNFGKKTAVFPGGYGWIGEMQHGQIWPDCGA